MYFTKTTAFLLTFYVTTSSSLLLSSPPKASSVKTGRSLFLDKKTPADTTRIGNIIVPSIGVGTINWSSDNCK